MLVATELHRFTIAELQAMAEHGVILGDARVELIDGLVVDMSPIKAEHAYLVDLAVVLYRRRWPADGMNEAPFVQGQQPIELDDRNQLVPDVSVVLGPIRRYRGRLPRAGEVLEVVEVADTSLEKDTGDKLRAYMAARVPAIVVIDVRGRRGHRWDESPGQPGTYVHTIRGGAEEWLPGVSVDQLFA